MNNVTGSVSKDHVYVFFQYDDQPCDTALWWCFVLASSLSYVLVLLVLSIRECCARGIVSRRPRGYAGVSYHSNHGPLGYPNDSQESQFKTSWTHSTRIAAREFILGRTNLGKIFTVTTFGVNMLMFVLYLLEVTNTHVNIVHEKCANWTGRLDWQLELVCSAYLALYATIRFVASDNKIRFMFGLWTIVDFITLVPAFLTLALDHHWNELLFLRVLYLVVLPDLLSQFGVLNRSISIRISQMGAWIVTVAFMVTGCLQVTESYGDLHLAGSNAAYRSYWEWAYFVVASLTTVGYGDIMPVSRAGKVLTTFFLVLSTVIFAACLPEIARLVESYRRYKGVTFKKSRRTRHVVVAGNLDKTAMEKFLQAFYQRHCPESRDILTVFVNERDPDLETGAFIKRNRSQMVYIQGSLLAPDDMERAQAASSAACILISDRASADSRGADDYAIMCAISVKSSNPQTRCLIQLTHGANKSRVKDIPNFGTTNGDMAICTSSLALGLLAGNCITPGLSTLLISLMDEGVSRSQPLQQASSVDDHKHISPRLRLQALNQDFQGMEFAEAAGTCFTALGVLLIGILDHKSKAIQYFSSGVRLQPDDIGIFIANSADNLKKVSLYCRTCHSGITTAEKIAQCSCGGYSSARSSPATLVVPGSPDATMEYGVSPPVSPLPGVTGTELRVLPSLQHAKSSKTYSTAESRSSLSKILHRAKAAGQQFSNHVIIFVFSYPTDEPIGLHDFIQPLQRGMVRSGEKQDIIVLGNARFLEKEWSTLKKSAGVFLVKGDPLVTEDLDSVSIGTCSACAIISTRRACHKNIRMDDKDAILLTLKLMKYTRLDACSLSAASINTTPAFTHRCGKVFTTALYHQSSMELVADKTHGELSAYTSARTFPYSALDSFVIEYLFNPIAMNFVEDILCGTGPSGLVTVADSRATSRGYAGEHEYSENQKISRPAVQLVPLFPHLALKHLSFKQLFASGLKLGYLCIGISRQLREYHGPSGWSSRTPILNPSADLVVERSDMVYVLRG